MFIHSRTVQVRTFATAMAIPVGWLVVMINPISNPESYASSPIAHWFGFLLMLSLLGLYVYVWRLAPTLPQPPLPDPTKWTGPNRIPVGTRLTNVALSAILLGYGTYGLYINDILIPARRGGGTHLSGTSAWIMYVAFLCAIANLLAVVADHYDRRNNERNYAHFTMTSQWLGWVFFFRALAWKIAVR
jgi:hypothetical protein